MQPWFDHSSVINSYLLLPVLDSSISGRRHLIFPATDETIRQATAHLAAGELIGLPTETVYGLAANAWDRIAVAKIFAAKSRPATNPLIVHVAGIERLRDALQWPPPPIIGQQLDALADFWPGPLTIVGPRGPKIPDEVTAGKTTVAVRVPAHPVARRLLQACPFPLAAPSANRSTYISPTLAEHVCDASGLGHAVSLVIDGGPCMHGVESTILLLGEHPRLLRPGSITAEQLAERLQIDVTELLQKPPAEGNSTHESLLAPGMMREHYAPVTPLVLLPHAGDAAVASAGQADERPIGRIAFRRLEPTEAARYQRIETLSDSGNLEEVARNLFAALRRLDAAGLSAIHCDTCSPQGLGQAIMDRLRRAAARTEC